MPIRHCRELYICNTFGNYLCPYVNTGKGIRGIKRSITKRKSYRGLIAKLIYFITLSFVKNILPGESHTKEKRYKIKMKNFYGV